jgi:hypothetical protein
MVRVHSIVFLVDVDHTLLDNDGIQQDLKDHLERAYGRDARDRYWRILEDLFLELGYRDYLGALQRFRAERPREAELLSMSAYLIDYPFAGRLFPSALKVFRRLRGFGPTVILSDGDVVAFAPAAADIRSPQICIGRGCRARCLCHGGRSGWLSRDHPHCFGERGSFGHPSPRSAGSSRDSISRCLDAILGHFRASAAVLSGRGVASSGDGPPRRVLGWDRYVGPHGRVIGMKTFGASAPLKELQRKFGFEPECVVSVAMELLGRN